MLAMYIAMTQTSELSADPLCTQTNNNTRVNMRKATTDYLDCLRLEHCKFDDAWTFVSDSQDVQAVKENVGEIATGFDSFFVKVGNGDYDEVWGIEGIVPYTYKNAYRIL